MLNNEWNTWESNLLSRTKFNEETLELIAEFKNGTQYLYKEVPKEIHDAFLIAESKGQYFLKEIRQKFTQQFTQYVKIEEAAL